MNMWNILLFYTTKMKTYFTTIFDKAYTVLPQKLIPYATIFTTSVISEY